MRLSSVWSGAIQLTLPLSSGVVRNVEGREAQRCWLVGVKFIDVMGETFASNARGIVVGHDQHDRLTRSDDATDRVDREFVYATRLWRADIDVLELILGGDLALAQLGDFGANIAELLGDFAARILVHLDDLQLDLRDLAASLGLCSDSCPRSPPSRAASRLSDVTRVKGMSFLFQRSRTPFNSSWMSAISCRLGVNLLR